MKAEVGASAPLRFGTLWTFDLSQPPAEIPVTGPTPVTFRHVGAESAEMVARAIDAASGSGAATPAMAREEITAEVQRRMAEGKQCYAAWAGHRLAAYGWVSFGKEEVGELGLTIRLEPCEAYIWDCFTLPAFRQKGIYSALLAFIVQALRAEGRCRAWIGANVDNQPSQRGIDRAGFRRVADLLISREGGQRGMWMEGYPGVEEGLVERARRVMLSTDF